MLWTHPTGHLISSVERLLPRWDEVARSGDVLQEITASLLSAANNATEKEGVRTLLVVRLILLNGDDYRLDQVINAARAHGEHPSLAKVFTVMLRLNMGLYGGATDGLFHDLMSAEHPWHDTVTMRFLMHKWQFCGPSKDLYDFIHERVPSLTTSKRAVLAELCSLLVRLDLPEQALRLLREFPELKRSAGRVLPIAMILAGEPRLLDDSISRSTVRRRVALAEAIMQGSRELERQMTNLSIRIAVVGNGPSAIGGRRGAAIDRHDMVIRFNKFSLEEEFSDDYGRKVDLIVRRSVNDTGVETYQHLANTILFNGPSFLYRNRVWDAVDEVWRTGKRIAAFPDQAHERLTRRIGAPPSAGLLMAVHLKSARGRLDREDFVGFGFVDQIGENPRSSHYFEKSKAVLSHNWIREREIFLTLFEGDLSASSSAV